MTTDTAKQNKSPPQHTPGPWRISGDHLGTKLLIEHGYSFQSIRSPFIASVYTDDGKLPQAANARLIAAGPELLTMLETAFDALGRIAEVLHYENGLPVTALDAREIETIYADA